MAKRKSPKKKPKARKTRSRVKPTRMWANMRDDGHPHNAFDVYHDARCCGAQTDAIIKVMVLDLDDYRDLKRAAKSRKHSGKDPQEIDRYEN